VLLVSIPVAQVPLVAMTPLQPPEAVHSVTFCAFQLRMDVPSLVTVDGDALKVTEGAEEDTTTSADCEREPPGPVHVNVKLVVAISGGVVAVPLIDLVPLQPPEAAQLCASVALHCKVVALPAGTLWLLATSVTAGMAAPVLVAVPVAALLTESVMVDSPEDDK
jgi:hypothetical protein